MQTPKAMKDRSAYIVLAVILIFVLLPSAFFLHAESNSANNPDCVYSLSHPSGTNYDGNDGTQGMFDGCFPVNRFIEGPEYQGTNTLGYSNAVGMAKQNAPSYVQTIKFNDTLIFHSMNITILAFGNANTFAAHVSGMPIGTEPHSNVTVFTNAFAIYGLYNPTLVIPRGATVNITFVNLDTGDHHNFVLTTFAPPFPEYIMQNMNVGGQMVEMTPLMNPATTIAHEFSFTVTLNVPSNVTQMWYMCMYPTHAMAGMWGNITLVNPSAVGAQTFNSSKTS